MNFPFIKLNFSLFFLSSFSSLEYSRSVVEDYSTILNVMHN
jgi:hypothetical protein